MKSEKEGIYLDSNKFRLWNLPVLSVQMVVAHPIVSQALSFLTRLCSFVILFDEKARASVTASGRPSGTATAKTVMEVTT